MNDDLILQTFNISKSFSGVKVLDDISMSIKRGEVHALLGENGAGKSTFVKIVSGAYEATSGYFRFDGQKITALTPKYAQQIGITIVYQELNLIPEMTVTENIFLGREIMTAIRKIHWRKMHQEAAKLLESFDIRFDVKAKIRSLSVAEQKMIEIVKAMSLGVKLIIMDEPTDVLTDKETAQLFQLIRRLKAEGKTIIYISHRIDELRHICDRFTVFRDGKYIYTGNLDAHPKDDIVQMMVGRKLTQQFPRVEVSPGRERFRVEHLSQKGVLHDISFAVNAGELLGVSGLVGSGRTELMKCIIGADRLDAGQLYLNNTPLRIKTPNDAIRKGIVYITESRKEYGLMLDLSVCFNISLASLKAYLTPFKKIDFLKEKQAANDMVKQLAIKTTSLFQEAKSLSGGNQQKVLLARGMLAKPQVLIVDEPTRGVDVGAKVGICMILNQLKQEGVAIIVVSSDLLEILGISDRVIVMYRGRINGVFSRAELSEEVIARCAFGKAKGGN